ncbi:unnamed protein product, partial [Brenthis ino]
MMSQIPNKVQSNEKSRYGDVADLRGGRDTETGGYRLASVMLHNTLTRAHFVECWRTREPEYINEAGYRGAPTREPATAASSPPIRGILSFRYHIWYCAAGSLRVPPPPPTARRPRPDAPNRRRALILDSNR